MSPIIEKGFTLIELIAIILLIGILGGVVASRSIPNTTLQLQAGRDETVSALFIAQSRAMAQADPVRVLISTTSIDIRQDHNQDATFSADESLTVAGVRYPLSFRGGVISSTHQLDYDRLGQTAATVITLSKAGKTVNVQVSGTGYAY